MKGRCAAVKRNYLTDNKCFMLYKDWEQLFSALTDRQAGQLVKALFIFAKTGTAPQLSGAQQMAFLMMSQQIVRDGFKWEEKCEKNANNIRKRWQRNHTTVYDGIQTDTDDTDTDTETDTDVFKD